MAACSSQLEAACSSYLETAQVAECCRQLVVAAQVAVQALAEVVAAVAVVVAVVAVAGLQTEMMKAVAVKVDIEQWCNDGCGGLPVIEVAVELPTVE